MQVLACGNSPILPQKVPRELLGALSLCGTLYSLHTSAQCGLQWSGRGHLLCLKDKGATIFQEVDQDELCKMVGTAFQVLQI